MDRLLPASLALVLLLVAMPAAAETLYVASNRIVVLDSTTDERIAEIELERFVFDIQFDPTGTRAYVGVSDGVIEIDAVEHRVLGRLTQSPAFALGMSDDGGLLYILGNDNRRLANGMQEALPSELTVYDLEARTVVESTPVGMRAEDFAVLAGDVAVMRPLDYVVAQIATDGNQVRSTRLEFQPEGDRNPGFLNGMTVSDDGSRVFVAQAASQVVIHSIEAATGATTTLPFGHQGFVTGLIERDGVLHVAMRNHIAVVDAATGDERAWIDLGAAHFGMALGSDAATSYHTLAQWDDNGGAVTVVDLQNGAVDRLIPLPGISPAAIAVRP